VWPKLLLHRVSVPIAAAAAAAADPFHHLQPPARVERQERSEAMRNLSVAQARGGKERRASEARPGRRTFDPLGVLRPGDSDGARAGEKQDGERGGHRPRAPRPH